MVSPARLLGTLVFIASLAGFSVLLIPPPTPAELHYSAALKHELEGQLEEAIREYGVAIRHDPQDTNAYIHKAIAHLRLGQYDRVLEVLAQEEDAIRAAPPGSS